MRFDEIKVKALSEYGPRYTEELVQKAKEAICESSKTVISFLVPAALDAEFEKLCDSESLPCYLIGRHDNAFVTFSIAATYRDLYEHELQR